MTGAIHEEVFAFMTISHSFLLRVGNFWDKII